MEGYAVQTAYPLFCMRTLVVIICTLIFISCKQDATSTASEAGVRVPLQYAKGFTITQFSDHYILTVRNPIDTNKIITHYYLSKNIEGILEKKDISAISIPVHSMVSLSTTHVGFLEALGLTDKLVGFSGTQYIYSDKVTQRVHNGAIKEVGNDGGIDNEVIIGLHPDIVMTYMSGNAGYDHIDKLLSLQQQPVVNNEYMELSPLGQAEWIKFIAVFFDALDTANIIYNEIVAEYTQLQQIAAKATTHPTVFTGMAFKGEWTIPGGKSFAATYLKDAGAEYIWADDDKTGNFPVSLETVMDKALQADYWIHPGAAASLKEMTDADPRYAYFSPWKTGKVYNNNARQKQGGGNDYWESGIVYPNKILADLVAIFHPELMQDTTHQFSFYTHLQ